MRPLAFALALLAAGGCASRGAPPPSSVVPHLLTEAEAVAKAERFVRVNGYVRAEDADPKLMQVERSLTYGSTPEELLPHRVGTLLPRACGVLSEAVRGFEKGWSVVFCYDPRHRFWHEESDEWRSQIRERSRVVVMDPYGTDIFIPHPDYSLTGAGIRRLPGMDDLEHLLASMPAFAAPPKRTGD
jgi:hypothetical protein